MDNTHKQGTVDPKETEMFQSLSTVWRDDEGMQPLKKMDVKIANYICQQIIEIGIANKKYENTPTPFRGLKILEVGCGGGFLSEEFARTGCLLTGIDPNEDLLKVVKIHAEADETLRKVTYATETVEEHCISNAGKYDVVVSNFVLEHVSDPEYFIKCCSKCVKPGGSLFMSAIAKTYLAWFIQILLLEYVLKVLPIGLHHLEKFINASVTENLIKSCGFEIKHTQGMFYDIFTKTMYWVPIHSYLYLTHAVRKKQIKKEKTISK